METPTLKINVDTTELDEAQKKLDKIIASLKEADVLVEKLQKPMEREWRRFELCFDNRSAEKDELYRLLDRLGLTRRELALIVLGLRARPGFGLKDFDT